MLNTFFTSIYDAHGAHRVLPHGLHRVLRRRWHAGIPAGKVVSFPLLELPYLAAMKPRPARKEQLIYAHFERFDARVAARLAAHPAQVVVGFENSARDTFRAARARGMTCVLDASSVHYQAQRMAFSDVAPNPRRASVERRKQEEIELAHHIVTLSSFARDTYLRAGVPDEKLTIVPLGIDTSTPPPGSEPRADDGVFRFMFAGNLTYAKGVDLLLQAFEAIPHDDVELVLAGAAGDAAQALGRTGRRVRMTGYLQRRALAKEYSNADVLVLPSRCDGFGQVVPEAMQLGIPCIVSSHVGAKDLIDHGATGWIVASGNAAALSDCMLEAYRNRSGVRAMGARAAAVARRYSWKDYGARVRQYYESILSEARRPSSTQRALEQSSPA